MIPRKCHLVSECQCHLVPESRFSPCSRTGKCHFIPELVIAISRMSFLLSPHFPEFEIVQNDTLGQNGVLSQNIILRQNPQYHISKFHFCISDHCSEKESMLWAKFKSVSFIIREIPELKFHPGSRLRFNLTSEVDKNETTTNSRVNHINLLQMQREKE